MLFWRHGGGNKEMKMTLISLPNWFAMRQSLMVAHWDWITEQHSWLLQIN